MIKSGYTVILLQQQMRTITPRVSRQMPQVVVKTVDLFTQPLPIAYGSLEYGMSVEEPLKDPYGYARQVSGTSYQAAPAQRITQNLAPTWEETEALNSESNTENKPLVRSAKGDPALKLAQLHNVKKLKESMAISGNPVSQYQNIKTIQSNTSENTASTPLRRLHSGPQGSTAKRQRTRTILSPNTSVDGDISMDTVHSVLRLVDETLMDSPERMQVVTPRVYRAAPVPSPREKGPAFAYSKSQLEKMRGLCQKQSSGLFGLTGV